MNIELALVDQQVQGLVQKLNTKLDNNPDKQISKAFLVLSIKTLFDIEDDEEAFDFIYDSGNDYSIDAIFVSDVVNDSFTIKIIQTKYKRFLKKDGTYYNGDSNFPRTDIEKMISSLSLVLDPNKDLLNSVTTSEKLDLKALDDLRITVYKSSFTDFANYFNSLNINNENLSKFNLEEDLQEVLIFQDESYEIDKPAVMNLKNNKFLIGTQYEVNQGVEFLNKSNKILESINLALKQDANDEVDFIKFSKEKQNLIFEGYDLAKKIEKLCISQELNDTYTRIKALYI